MPDYAQLLLAALEPEPEEVLAPARNRLAELGGELASHATELEARLEAEHAARRDLMALCDQVSALRAVISSKQAEKSDLAKRLITSTEKAATLAPLREKILSLGTQPAYMLPSSPLALVDFTRSIEVLDRSVKFETRPVQLYHEALDALFPRDDTRFGPFTATVTLIPYSYGHTLSVTIAPGSGLGVSDLLHHSGYVHPHVDASGRACLGEYTGLLSAAMESGDVLSTLYLTCKFLRHYNPASPYVKITKFGIAERDPWSNPYCAECKRQLHLCSCVIETYEWCPGCLTKLPANVPACGWCPTCCVAKHKIAPSVLTAMLDGTSHTTLDVGLNGSTCVML